MKEMPTLTPIEALSAARNRMLEAASDPNISTANEAAIITAAALADCALCLNAIFQALPGAGRGN